MEAKLFTKRTEFKMAEVFHYQNHCIWIGLNVPETGFVGDFNPSFETEKGSLKEETSSLKWKIKFKFKQ